jgi:hypothetical protein
MKEIHMSLKKTIRPLKFFIGDALIYSFWKSKKCKRESGKKNSEFKRDGVVKLDFNFSEHLEELRNYLLNEEICVKEGSVSNPRVEKGLLVNIFCSFNLQAILKICTDSRLISQVEQYYGSTSYLRNDPQIQRLSIQSEDQFDNNYFYHIDRFNQVSAMILLSEVTMESTHMVYANGTQKRKFGFFDLRRLYGGRQIIKKLAENSDSLTHLIGSPGDIYLFDSMGFHRADYKIGTERDCIFLNFTNGHNLYKWRASSNIGDLSKDARHIHRSDKNLVFADENKNYNGPKYFHSDIFNKF